LNAFVIGKILIRNTIYVRPQIAHISKNNFQLQNKTNFQKLTACVAVFANKC